MPSHNPPPEWSLYRIYINFISPKIIYGFARQLSYLSYVIIIKILNNHDTTYQRSVSNLCICNIWSISQTEPSINQEYPRHLKPIQNQPICTNNI